MTSENILINLEETQEIVLKAMHNKWQFCLGLHLHHGRRPPSFPNVDANTRIIGLAPREFIVEPSSLHFLKPTFWDATGENLSMTFYHKINLCHKFLMTHFVPFALLNQNAPEMCVIAISSAICRCLPWVSMIYLSYVGQIRCRLIISYHKMPHVITWLVGTGVKIL